MTKLTCPHPHTVFGTIVGVSTREMLMAHHIGAVPITEKPSQMLLAVGGAVVPCVNMQCLAKNRLPKDFLDNPRRVKCGRCKKDLPLPNVDELFDDAIEYLNLYRKAHGLEGREDA